MPKIIPTLSQLTRVAQRSFSVHHGNASLTIFEQMKLAAAVATTHNGKPLYGPFIHGTKNNEDLHSILHVKHLLLNENSGISGRRDAVYALARTSPKELDETIREGLGRPLSNSLTFYTHIAPYATAGGHTGPHVSWNEDAIPERQLNILPVLSIRAGVLVVENQALAKTLESDLPPNSSLREKIQAQDHSNLPPSSSTSVAVSSTAPTTSSLKQQCDALLDNTNKITQKL